MAVQVDEQVLATESPADYVLRLARAKAHATTVLAHSEHIIVAADTTVVDGNDILGKPQSMVQAIQMLEQLRGHTHHVYSAIAALRVRDNHMLTDLCITAVPMRSYSDQEISAYAATGDPLDKAGAYAIQHAGFQPVEKLSGCYASVMGLPMCHLVRTLRRLDIAPTADVPANCQSSLRYQCSISRAVLRGEQIG